MRQHQFPNCPTAAARSCRGKIHRPSSRPPSSHTPSFSIHCLPPSSVVWGSRFLPVPTFVPSCPGSSYRIALCLSRSTRYVHGALAPSERPEEHAHTPIRGSRSEGRAPAACLPLQGHYPNSAERGMAAKRAAASFGLSSSVTITLQQHDYAPEV